MRPSARAPIAAPTDNPETLGTRLRGLRHEKGFSMAQLAARSGVPVSTISKIENGQLNPSLVHAINLASALDANLGFLADQSRTRHARYSIVRAGQRERRRFPEIDMVLEDLNAGFAPGLLEARIGVIEAGTSSGTDYMTHPGDEFVHVIAGSVSYDIDGSIVDLQEGDCLHFKCRVPHRWTNTFCEPSTLLWVFSDGLSF
jgi:transcriptional regulator with XRE-family HTH domain